MKIPRQFNLGILFKIVNLNLNIQFLKFNPLKVYRKVCKKWGKFSQMKISRKFYFQTGKSLPKIENYLTNLTQHGE